MPENTLRSTLRPRARTFAAAATAAASAAVVLAGALPASASASTSGAASGLTILTDRLPHGGAGSGDLFLTPTGPDGNSVELQADWFGDWERSKAYMKDSPQFREDPIGTFVDPRALLAARRGGESPERIHERAFAGEFPPRVKPVMRVGAS